MIFIDLTPKWCYLIEWKYVEPFRNYLYDFSFIFDPPQIPHYMFGLCLTEEDRKNKEKFNEIVMKFGIKYKRIKKKYGNYYLYNYEEVKDERIKDL